MCARRHAFILEYAYAYESGPVIECAQVAWVISVSDRMMLGEAVHINPHPYLRGLISQPRSSLGAVDRAVEPGSVHQTARNEHNRHRYPTESHFIPTVLMCFFL